MNLLTKSAVVIGAGIVAIAALSLFLWQVFSGQWVLPQALSLGPFEIRYYGIFMSLAVLAGYTLAIRRAGKFRVSAKEAEQIFVVLIVSGLVGARLYHVASAFNYYLDNPASIPLVWQGGLSIYGAVAGGLIGLAVYSYWQRRSQAGQEVWLAAVRRYADWLVPSVLIGQIIGRFGNLFNYEIFGYPTGFPWKMFVPESFRPLEFLSANFFHPLFLYEAVALSLILITLRRRNPVFSGSLFLWYILLYNMVRFFLEFLRTDSAYIGDFRLNAAVSAFLVVIAGIILYITWVYAKRPQNN